MNVDLEHLFAILREIATRGDQITYGQLSQEYYNRTHDWHEPHGSWDEPLGRLNRTLNSTYWPPISAVVVLQEEREPGGGFWESSPNVPSRPADDVSRISLYAKLLREVHKARWPMSIPTAPPKR